jgi:hypothetical protein
MKDFKCKLLFPRGCGRDPSPLRSSPFPIELSGEVYSTNARTP